MIQNVSLAAYSWMLTVRRRLGEEMMRDDGQGLMEYSVLLGAIAITAAAAILVTPFDFGTFFDTVQGCLNFDAAACDF